MTASKRRVPRHPLAWGMTKWGPLPDTEDMWIFWGGPGDGLEMFARDPSASTIAQGGRRIQHPTASGTYATLAAAEKAVNAFVAAGIT
jgi:hypothetical protein